ncbi:MAG TPA: hypothetical protein VK151_01050 [Fluviicola sp.]|nr:hypothetical protein [Fluviicola sp.]
MRAIRFIFAAVILCSVSSFVSTTEKHDPLIGTWVYAEYDEQEEAMIYTKASSFEEDKPGIEFKASGKLVKRQNVGWCGTPPIDYGNNDGTWKQTSDSIITISYHYWGGTAEEDWQIVQVSDTKLMVKQLDYRTDRKTHLD